MILVDIQVPALDGIYDFELEEESKVGELTKEIQTLLTMQEQLTEAGGIMSLYGVRQERSLKEDESLKQQGVREGDQLILI